MPGGEPAPWRQPMLAQPLHMPAERRALDEGNWVYERKLDGLRCLAVRNGRQVELWSRNHLTFTARFPEIVRGLGALAADNFTVDGEVVAFDGDRTSFAMLQRPGSPARPVYFAFDVLHLLGHDTTVLPLGDRTDLLARLLAGAPDAVRGVERLAGDPTELLDQACRDRWEGLIAKRVGSPYRTGRSSDWRKLKCSASQELVIGGWTDPAGARTAFGALLVGYFEDDGRLRYAGRVGTGFDERELRRLHQELTARHTAASPFDDQVPAKATHWVRPELVAQVAFTEWTTDGRLRHPRYEGLRPDKPARDVRRET